MKATEIKAKELVEKFKTHPLISQGEAVQFAIICVEEIIKTSPHSPSKPLERMPHLKACKFWQEVLTILKAM